MRATSMFLFSLLAFACNKDRDGDKYKADEDCDDDNNTIFPGADERCDGVDNNCDGSVDEGAGETWYIDVDGDLYGDESGSVRSCSAIAGYVAATEEFDCDDTNALVHPNAAEDDCTDSTDYNCDGSGGSDDYDSDGVAGCEDCDDTDSSVQDGYTWYIDYDQDGFGTEDYSVVDCEAPDSFFSAVAGDCDDRDAVSFPDAPEICDDVDNDCDGLTDIDDSDYGGDVYELYTDADGDGYGDPETISYACATDSSLVEEGADCDDGNMEISPAATETCNDGIDNDCDGGFDGCTIGVNSADAIYFGDVGWGLGLSLDGAGDINQDGYDDAIVGADSADVDGDGSSEGAGFIVYGPLSTTSTGAEISTADVILTGDTAADQAGYRVAHLGDVDGDLVPDVGLTAPQLSYVNAKSGGLYVMVGADIQSGTLSLADDASALLYGDRAYDFLGAGLSGVGDVNDDGFSDFAVGAVGDDDGGAGSGVLFLFYGAADYGDKGVAASKTSATALIAGTAANDQLGGVVAGPGDMDGDGVDDLVIPVKYHASSGSNSGSVYFVLGTPPSGSYSVADTDAEVYGSGSGDLCGSAAAPAGDQDGDGLRDLWVGATNDNTTTGEDSGSVYLLLGVTSLSSAMDGQLIEDIAIAHIYGTTKDDRIGGALAGGDDVDGDGTDDLLVGATKALDNDKGVTFLIYGGFAGTYDIADVTGASINGEESLEASGAAVALLGDTSGSGLSSLGIAGVDSSRGGADAGSVYFFNAISQ